MSPGRLRNGEAGFSLMETVVAVAVIGLLSLLMMETLRFARLGHQRGLEAREAARSEAGAAAALRGLIEAAQPLLVQDEDGRRMVFFEGRADRLVLAAPFAALDGARGPASTLSGRAGLAVFALAVERAANGAPALMLRAAPLEPLSEETRRPSGALRVAVARDIAALELRYFGPETADGGADEGVWLSEWRGRADLPLAVSLLPVPSAVAARGGGRPAPPWVVQPRHRASLDGL